MLTYIWSFPTRLFHWLTVICLVGAYILGETEAYFNYHFALGYSLGFLLLFRILWGIIGPKYSHFRDFPIGIGPLKRFITNMKDVKHFYAGHNPLASIVMLCIIISILVVVGSGMLILASNGEGILPKMDIGIGSETAKELHETTVGFLIAFIVIHLLGILTDTILQGPNGSLTSIFTGYKRVKGDQVTLNSFQIGFSIAWFLVPLCIFIYTITNPDITSYKANLTEPTEQYEEEEED
jgi:cytochrome b